MPERITGSAYGQQDPPDAHRARGLPPPGHARQFRFWKLPDDDHIRAVLAKSDHLTQARLLHALAFDLRAEHGEDADTPAARTLFDHRFARILIAVPLRVLSLMLHAVRPGATPPITPPPRFTEPGHLPKADLVAARRAKQALLRDDAGTAAKLRLGLASPTLGRFASAMQDLRDRAVLASEDNAVGPEELALLRDALMLWQDNERAQQLLDDHHKLAVMLPNAERDEAIAAAARQCVDMTSPRHRLRLIRNAQRHVDREACSFETAKALTEVLYLKRSSCLGEAQLIESIWRRVISPETAASAHDRGHVLERLLLAPRFLETRSRELMLSSGFIQESLAEARASSDATTDARERRRNSQWMLALTNELEHGVVDAATIRGHHAAAIRTIAELVRDGSTDALTEASAYARHLVRSLVAGNAPLAEATRVASRTNILALIEQAALKGIAVDGLAKLIVKSDPPGHGVLDVSAAEHRRLLIAALSEKPSPGAYIDRELVFAGIDALRSASHRDGSSGRTLLRVLLPHADATAADLRNVEDKRLFADAALDAHENPNEPNVGGNLLIALGWDASLGRLVLESATKARLSAHLITVAKDPQLPPFRRKHVVENLLRGHGRHALTLTERDAQALTQQALSILFERTIGVTARLHLANLMDIAQLSHLRQRQEWLSQTLYLALRPNISTRLCAVARTRISSFIGSELVHPSAQDVTQLERLEQRIARE